MKPGDRQARPTSWMPSAPPSLAVSGLPVAGDVLFTFLDRSNRRGRWRDEVDSSGEPGSFLTMILGGPPALRELVSIGVSIEIEAKLESRFVD